MPHCYKLLIRRKIPRTNSHKKKMARTFRKLNKYWLRTKDNFHTKTLSWLGYSYSSRIVEFIFYFLQCLNLISRFPNFIIILYYYYHYQGPYYYYPDNMLGHSTFFFFLPIDFEDNSTRQTSTPRFCDRVNTCSKTRKVWHAVWA